MTKTQLIEEIEAYARAKASGSPLLAQRQGEVLQRLLNMIPDEIEEAEPAPPTPEQPAPIQSTEPPSEA